MGSWSGGMPDPLPPRLHCSKTPTCLIMINCCLDNQIQTQKVGDDSPRTRRERQGMCSLGKKRVPPPHSLTLLILSIPNRINSKIMWEDSPGRTETPVCVFPAQTHFLSLFSSFSGSHLLQRCQFDDWGRLRNDWLPLLVGWHKERERTFHDISLNFASQLKAINIVNREILKNLFQYKECS